MKQSLNITAVDLFCGAGGLTHGFIKEGINVAAGIDNDATCRYAYEKNNLAKFVPKKIEDVTAGEIVSLYPKGHIQVLMGCAPCQPFSSYNNRKSKDDKWGLLYEFSRLIMEVKPDIVSMENVPQLIRHAVFDDFVRTLSTEGYEVSWNIVFCPEYGIPQNRKRLILFASRFGKIKLTEAKKRKKCATVRDAIGGLEPLKAGGISGKDPLHKARNLSELNKLRIMNTPPGGGWKDWKPYLLLKCHRKKSGKSYGSVYGRMRWDKPSPTITTQFAVLGCGRFGHPEQDRAISYREASLLQTFPKSYDFIDPSSGFSGSVIARHIGNAVPVELGRVIARSIKNHIGCYEK